MNMRDEERSSWFQRALCLCASVPLCLTALAAEPAPPKPEPTVDVASLPANQWARLGTATLGPRGSPQLVFDAALGRFMVLGGDVGWAHYPKPHPFDELALDLASGRWENWIPEGKDWGPQFGDCKAPGWKHESWTLADAGNNVRPSLVRYTGAKWYDLSAYSSEKKCTYFYVSGSTFAYDSAARKWTDLTPAAHPTKALGGLLLWSSMCWDPGTKKVVLFGGGNVTSPRGDPGTWTYDPAANAWEQLKFESAALDGPRGKCAELFGRAKRLAEALRARHYRSELPDQKKADLGKEAAALAAEAGALDKELESAAAKADEQEKRQVGWARESLRTATAALSKVREPVAAAVLADADAGREAFGAARDALALEPPQRAFSRLVADPEGKRIILFGGDRLDRMLADTWVFDCAAKRWIERRPAASPAPRAGHALVWLPKAKKALLFGGFTYRPTTEYCGAQYANLPFEMWVFDPAGGEWKLLARAADAKGVPNSGTFARYLAAAADAEDRVVALEPLGYYLATPATWVCRVDASKAAGAEGGVPPGTIKRRSGPFVPEFFDAAPPADPAAAEAKLKDLPANTWVRLAPPAQPKTDRCWGTAGYSPDHDVIMHWSGGHSSHCGTEVIRYHPGIDRWSLATDCELPLEYVYGNDGTPGQWSFSGRPWMTGHTYGSYAYDPVLKRVVLAGKNDHTYFFDPGAGEWDGHMAGNPFNGSFYTAKVTTTPKGVVVWAQTLRDSTKSGLWQMDAATRSWKALPLTGTLPGFGADNNRAAYDSKRDRLLCFTNVAKGDVTAYDMKSGQAQLLSPAGKDKAEAMSREVVYLEHCDMVLIGAHVAGPDGQMVMPVYDCAKNAWLGADLGGANPVSGGGKRVGFHNSIGFVYDPARKLVWALDQGSGVSVLRFDPAGAGVKELK
jgi:hypothetical protein